MNSLSPSKKHHKTASTQTLNRWLENVLRTCRIDMGICTLDIHVPLVTEYTVAIC